MRQDPAPRPTRDLESTLVAYTRASPLVNECGLNNMATFITSHRTANPRYYHIYGRLSAGCLYGQMKHTSFLWPLRLALDDHLSETIKRVILVLVFLAHLVYIIELILRRKISMTINMFYA